MTNEGFYEDIAVLAYPALQGEVLDARQTVDLSSSDPSLDVSRVADGNPATTDTLEIERQGTGWLQFSYPEPVSIRHLEVRNIASRDLTVTPQTNSEDFSRMSCFGCFSDDFSRIFVSHVLCRMISRMNSGG